MDGQVSDDDSSDTHDRDSVEGCFRPSSSCSRCRVNSSMASRSESTSTMVRSDGSRSKSCTGRNAFVHKGMEGGGEEGKEEQKGTQVRKHAGAGWWGGGRRSKEEEG